VLALESSQGRQTLTDLFQPLRLEGDGLIVVLHALGQLFDEDERAPAVALHGAEAVIDGRQLGEIGRGGGQLFSS